ncbi:hypothetical protein KAU51_04515 [Candidatus Parcubacteria bacterium]|nr:hypothetical protein [Candidatus Parcubacteria bacterium]
MFNRPEMFYLSIESEIEARKYFTGCEYLTIFCVEYGASQLILDIIKDFYPFNNIIHQRLFRHHGWGNILEGLKSAFVDTDEYVLNLEDDCLLHKTYFKYIHEAHKLTDDKCSVINSSNRSTPGRDKHGVNRISKTWLFEATCCLINKYFFKKYVESYATNEYYTNRASVINKINLRNGDDKRSKYRPSRNNLLTHIGWDGLVNRLIDTSNIEESMYALSPSSDRRLHIGFYGQNRRSNFTFTEQDFLKRVNILRTIIKDPQKMGKIDGHHFDYDVFVSELDNWDGNLLMAV